MTTRQLPDEYLQEIFDKLEDAGKAHALAKANLIGLSEMIKVHRRELMAIAKAHGIGSRQAQEDAAYSNPVYSKMVADLVAATKSEKELEYARELLKMEWDSFRTRSANSRGNR